MKRYLFVILIGLLYMGCSDEQKGADMTEIKVFVFGSADSVTAYNKDYGITSYLYYNVNLDSAIYRYPTSFDPYTLMTYAGSFGDKKYVDTLRYLVQFLHRYQNGTIPNNLPGDARYCGPEFYVEYHDSEGEHYHSFILHGNDTLNKFSDFFERVVALPWSKKIVSNTAVNADTEVVAAIKKLGVYEKLETPYIPQKCAPGIDNTQMIGTWRTAGSKFYSRPNDYTKFTFKPNGMYVIEKVREGKPTRVLTGKYKLNAKSNTFILKSEKGNYTYKIDKLNTNCFEYRRVDREDLTTRLDRL